MRHLRALIFSMILVVSGCQRQNWCRCTQEIWDNGQLIGTGGPWIEEEPCESFGDSTQFGDHLQVIIQRCEWR